MRKTQPKPYDLQIDTALQLVKRARVYYEIWRYQNGADSPAIDPSVKDRFGWFFHFDEHAHLVAAVVTLAALFDSADDTINFGALINAGHHTRKVPAKLCAVARALLDEADPFVGKIMLVRHDLFAQSNATLGAAQSPATAELYAGLIKELCEVGLRIGNLLSVARNHGEQLYPMGPRQDLEKIVAVLKTTPPDRLPD